MTWDAMKPHGGVVAPGERKERCAECRFSAPQRMSYGTEYFCRFNAPVVAVSPAFAWPYVGPEDWCGKYQERKAAEG